MFTEHPVYEPPDGAVFEDFGLTDAGIIYCLEGSSDGIRVVLDGKPQPMFQGIDRLRLSDDGRRCAYIALRGERYLVVIDGEPGPEFDDISVQVDPTFGPGGHHVIYGGITGGMRCVLVLDGDVHDDVFLAPVSPAFSADGKRLAYVAQADPEGAPRRTNTSDEFGRWVVVNGEAGRRLEAVSFVTLSPDGEHVLYVGTTTEGLEMSRTPMTARPQRAAWRVYVDHVPGPELDGIKEPRFSPDGRRYAYAALRGDREVLVVDGEVVAEGDVIGERVFFSPDGNRLAYLLSTIHKGFLRSSTTETLVVDGEAGPEFDEVLGSLEGPFSPDSRRFGYLGMKDGRAQVIVDGRPHLGAFDSVQGPVFTPDSTTVVFTATAGGESRVMYGDKAGPAFDSVSLPWFGPDGRLAYLGVRNDRMTAVHHDAPGPFFEALALDEKALFTPDGGVLTYAGKIGGRMVPVIGDETGPAFDQLSAPAHVGGQVVWAGLRDRSVIRVESPFPQGQG